MGNDTGKFTTVLFPVRGSHRLCSDEEQRFWKIQRIRFRDVR